MLLMFSFFFIIELVRVLYEQYHLIAYALGKVPSMRIAQNRLSLGTNRSIN
jgi:hypothetical protein